MPVSVVLTCYNIQMYSFITFVNVYLAYALLLAIPALLITGLFARTYKKIFYSSLIFIALYLYLYVTLNAVFSPSFGVLTHHVLLPYAKFWGTVRITLIFIAVYSVIGIAVSLIRYYLKLASAKLLKLSLIGLAIGALGLLIFYLLPCEFSPDGCMIGEPDWIEHESSVRK